MMEDLRSWWEVPSIAHFCSLFRAAFDLSDFDIEDLEEGLLESEKETGCEFLTDLVCKLLNGCYGREDICSFNYDLYIKDIIKYKWDSTDNPILKKSAFTELTLREKVEVIHSICEYRLDGEDVMELLKGFDGDSMRVEPLGKDKEGGLYWYFYGSRLYKEDPEIKKELTKEQKRKQEREKRKERRKEQQRKKKLEKEQHKQEKVQRRTARRVEKKKLLEMKKKEEEEESKGKRRRSGRIQKIHEQQLMESSSESSSESSTSEEESESEESSSEEVSEEEEGQESNSDTELEEEAAIENKTPKKENKKQSTAKVKKTTEKPTPVPVEKKAGKRQRPSRKKQTSKPDEEKPENSRRSGRLRQKNTRSQIDDRQSDSGIDDSDKDSSDEDSRSVTSEISRRSTKSEISARSDSVKKELPKRNTRSDKKLSKSNENEKPNTSKSTVDAETKPVKGRGRSRKTHEQDDADKEKVEENHHIEDENELETKSEKDSEKPKGRGRPRKTVNHEDSDDKKKAKANNVEHKSDLDTGIKSEKAKGRRRSGKINDQNEKNADHAEGESDSEIKSENDSEKPRSKGRPRKSAKLSIAPEGAHEKDDLDCEGNHFDHEDETEEKSETVMTRRRSLRHSTESNPYKNQEDKEKNNVKTEIEKSDNCEEHAEVKDEADTKTEVKMETENEKEISKDCNTNSTHDISDKDTRNSEIVESENVKTETVNKDGKTLNEKDFSEAKSMIKTENEIKDEKDVDSTEVKVEIIPDGEENEENQPKKEAPDPEEVKIEETEDEKKVTPVQSPEVKPRPKPTPPPKSKTGSRWHLICTTLDDWINLAEWFKESTVRCEKALTKVIEEDFLPVLPEIIETREKEKERRQRENEQRKSARITQKQREKMETEKILAEAAMAEDKARKEAEEERRLKEEHERLEHENKLREERVKAREERAKRLSMREERARLMAEGKDIPPELIYTGLPAQRYKDDFDSDDSKPDFLDDESFQALQKVIDGMKNHKDSWPFLEPVTEEQAPGYHDVIKRPMDLSKIEKKVDLREYRTQHHFLSDFRLMFNNCRRFNGADSDFTDCAKTMEKHLKILVKKHLLEQPTDSYYDDEDFVSSAARGASQGEKKIRPKRQAGTKALQTVHKALMDDGEESSGEDVEVQTEPVKKRKIMTEEAISPSVRSLLLQEMIEFKRKRAEQRASGQMVPPKPPTTQGIMIMPREEIPTDGVLRLAASREIRWKIDPNNVSLKKGSIESGRTSTVVKTQEPATQPTRLGRPPVSSVGQSPRPPVSSTGQSPNVNPPGPAANSSSAVRPTQNTLNVVHKKAVGLAPGQKIIKILASAPGTGIHAVRQTAESVKVSSDGYLILNGKPTSIKVTPNTKIVIQPQGAGDSQGSADGASQGSEGSGHTVGSPLGKEVVIKKIPTPAGLQPLSDNEASVSIQPIHQNLEQVSRTGSIQNQSPQNHRQYNVKIGQGQPPARTIAGNQQQGMVPGRVTVQTPRVVNVTGQQNVVPGSGNNPNRTMASDSIEARKQQLDIAQRLLAAKRRQLMQNGPISPKVARLEKDSSPLISSPNVAISRPGNVGNSNVDRVNSLSSNVLQNVNISSDILDSYYSVMNEGGGQKTAEFTAVPLTSIQQSTVQGTSLTNVQQSVQSNPLTNVQQNVQGTPVNIVHQGVQGNTNARNVAIPQHTPVNINRLLHSSPPKNSIVGTPVTVTKSEVSEGSKIMSISALTTALARNIAAGNVQLNRTAPKGTERQLSSGQNTNVVNQNLVTSQTQPVQLGSDSGNPVVINVDPKGGVTQQYLNISQPVQTVIQSPQVMSQAVQFVSQPIQILNQSPQVICRTSQILSQPVVQKSQSVSSAISELLKSTVINNSVSNLLTTDSVGLQNQILSSLANVQTQQIQTLASMPKTQTYLTSIQNQSLSSQSQLKPIEALFTGQTAPVMLSSTNKVHQFSPYKPGVSNVSPPKSDRQNLFDVFESGKNETVISPTKSDDFGFASLASDRIPIPVRQSGFPVISDEVLARGAKPTVRGNEFVGSPLNSSVMEALKSKLSPGKPLTGLQPRQVLNLYVEDPIPCSDTVVASPNKTNPAQDNSIITNPVVLDHESSNSIVTKDHEQSNFTVAEDTEQSNYNSVVTNDHEQSNSIVTNNCIESRNISKCSKRETLDELELSEGELNNNDITDAKSETNDTTGCAEIDATETTKCKKCDVENITEEPITNTKDAKVKARNCTEGMEVVASSTAGIVLESRDTKETIESEATDITEAIEMEIAASDSTDMKDEVMDSTECKEVEATGSTECIEAVDNNIIVIKMDTKEAAETEKCMEVEDQEITESLREETHTIVKSKESCALGTTNNVEEKAQEIAKSEEKTNTLKVDCDASDSDTNRISASKGLKTIDVKMHADKDKVKIDMNDFLYKTKPQSVPSNQKSTVQNESNLTVLDFSFPELYMTKNQEPAMVLTVKKDTKSMPEDSYQSSLEGQLEEENTGNVQLRACDRNGIGSEDANLENYLSTGMFTSSRLKKHNYTVYHYEGEKEEDLPIATSDSEQSHGKEKKTYSRKSTRRHTCKTKSEQSASFDESPESFEEYLESDEQFEEEFYRSLLCRQKAADSSLLKTDESLTKPISEHKQSEQYLGLTMSGGDSKKCDHIVFHDFQVENDNTEIKSSPKRTRILIKTKLDDGTVIRRQVWRLKSSDELGEVEQTEEEKSEEQAKNCSVWRQKLPKDLRKGKRKPSKKSSKKAENEKTGQVWRIKSPEELGKKDKHEQTGQELPVTCSTTIHGNMPLTCSTTIHGNMPLTCATTIYGMIPLQGNTDSVLQPFKCGKSFLDLQPFKFSKSLLDQNWKAAVKCSATNCGVIPLQENTEPVPLEEHTDSVLQPIEVSKSLLDQNTEVTVTTNCGEMPLEENIDSILQHYRFSKSQLKRISGPYKRRSLLKPTGGNGQYMSDRNEMLSDNIRDLVTAEKTQRATPAKRKSKKSPEKISPLQCYSPPKLYKLRGVSSDSAISVTSGLDSEEADLSSQQIRFKLKLLQNQTNEDTPTQEWKLKAVHSDSMVDYTLVRSNEETMLNTQEGQSLGDDALNKRYRTIPYSGSLINHEQTKKRQRVIFNTEPLAFTRQTYRSLLGPGGVQKCKKSLIFQDNRGFGDSYTHELDSNPLLNDSHVNVVCSSPSPSFINDFMGSGGDVSDVSHSLTQHEYDISGGSLTFDDHLFMDNLNLLPELTEDPDFNRIENDIFELQEQYLKPAEQTVSSPLTMFSTIAPKVGVQDQTQGNYVNKQVVIGTLPDSLRQAQSVSISIAEEVPNWQQNSQTQGNVQSKVVVESLPNVQSLLGRSDNPSAIEPNVNSLSSPLPVSNQVKTIESIFAGNDTNTGATSSIANLLAATIGQPKVSLGLENKPLQINSPFSPQTLMNNATYVGSINVPGNQQVSNSGHTSTDSGQKLGALEAMFLKGINVEQTVISQTPVMTAPSEEVVEENGDGSAPEIEFTAVKLDQT